MLDIPTMDAFKRLSSFVASRWRILTLSDESESGYSIVGTLERLLSPQGLILPRLHELRLSQQIHLTWLSSEDSIHGTSWTTPNI